MWIVNLRSGKRSQVAKDLSADPAIGCCMFVESIDNKGYGDTVTLVNGAFWTRKNEVLVTTPARTGSGMEFFLSMDGKLKGDV